MTTNNPYAGYACCISTEPSYYGPECTPTNAVRIASDLARMIAGQFPGITIETDGQPVTGPDADTCEEIRLWIEQNWTAAL